MKIETLKQLEDFKKTHSKEELDQQEVDIDKVYADWLEDYEKRRAEEDENSLRQDKKDV